MITRENFFALKPEVREVHVPALGESVHVKQMTAGERDRFEVEQLKSAEKDFRARLAAATVCDADGVLLFNEGDVAKLSAVPAHALDSIAKAAVELNLLTAEDVEGLAKN